MRTTRSRRADGVVLLGLVLAASCASDTPSNPEPGVSQIQQELMTPGPARQAVTFRHDDPEAQSVRLEFTGNYWNRDPDDTIELERVDDDVSSHALTLHLGEDQWLYRYRVDGRWTTDAGAPRVGAENGQENSVVVVGAPIERARPAPAVTAGTIDVIDIDSDILGRSIPYVLYTPASSEPLDVLVLLHGFGQPATDWSEAVGIGNFMDNLIAEGLIEPFAIVMPSGENSLYNSNRSLHIVDEVLPDAERRLGLDPEGASDRSMAIGGFSQGGAGALRIAALRPDDFGLVMPIAMAGPCGGLCTESLYDQNYPDGFTATFALWVGVDDELDLDIEHDRFIEFAAGSSIEFEDVRSDSTGHRQSGHSIRYVRTIAADVLIRADQFFTTGR